MEEPDHDPKVDLFKELAHLVQSIPTSRREGRGFESLIAHRKKASSKEAFFDLIQTSTGD